jgi:hypothetical protein
LLDDPRVAPARAQDRVVGGEELLERDALAYGRMVGTRDADERIAVQPLLKDAGAGR